MPHCLFPADCTAMRLPADKKSHGRQPSILYNYPVQQMFFLINHSSTDNLPLFSDKRHL